MRKLLLVLVGMLLISSPLRPGQTCSRVSGDCGTGNSSLCGSMGDPYEGGSFDPSGKYSLAACDTNLTWDRSYYLTQNVGPDATAKCFGAATYGNHWLTIDLRGYTVTGYIDLAAEASTVGPIIVFNGTVTCNVSVDATNRGCVNANPAGAPTAQSRLHHITVNQIYSAGGSVAVRMDGGNATGHYTWPEARIDHISVTSVALASSRYTCLNTNTHLQTELDHNLVHCIGATSACQGLVAYANPIVAMHNNSVTMDNATVSQGRGFLLDQGAGQGSGNTADVYNNLVTVNNNMGVRYRGGSPAQNGKVYGNTFLNITANNTLAAILLGENDVALAYESVEIYGNTFELNGSGGQGITSCSATGPNIHDNTVTCYAGSCSGASYFAYTNVEGGLTGGSDMTVKNTTLPAGWGASQKAIGVCGTGGALTCTNSAQATTTTYCNTGTYPAQFDVGAGATATQSCP